MKTIVYPICILASILIAISCNKDEMNNTTIVTAENAIVINGGMTTKATNDQWATGDAIGVTVFDPAYSGVIDEQFNKKYVTSQTLGTFNAVTDDHIAYFPQDGSAIRLKSYYPYKQNLSSDMIYPVSVTDQTILPNIDLMTAEHQNGFTKTDPNVKLHFYHRLSKLDFVLSVQDDADFVSPENCQLVIQGMETGNTYDLFNDTFGNASEGIDNIIVPRRTEDAGNERQAIVLPRPAGEGVIFRFVTPAGDTYIANMSEELELQSGYRYTFYITLSKNPITVSATIQPWITDDPMYYESFRVSTPAGDSYGVTAGDVMNVYLQGDSDAFSLLRQFTYSQDNEWTTNPLLYWEDIEPNPAVLRASIIAAAALNNTQLPDILIADEISVPRHTGANFNLTHAASKVTIRLQSSTFEDEDLQSATIKLPNYLINGKEELGQFIEGTDRGDVNVDRSDVNNGIALFQSQYIQPSNPVLIVTINGRDYNVYDRNGFTFEQGIAYLLLVTLEKEAVSLSAKVVDWVTETYDMEAVTIGTAVSGGVNVLNGENLLVYYGDDVNRQYLNTFTYYESSNIFSSAIPSYWENLPDQTNFYGYIKRADKYNNTQLDDYLVATPVTVSASNGVSFELKHAAAQVVVKITSSDSSFTSTELQNLSLILPNYTTGGVMNNGVFVPGSLPANVTVAKNVGVNNASALALIQPQTINAGTTVIEVQSNNRTYRATYEENIEFKAGVSTILNIDIKKTALTVSAEVVDWEIGQTINMFPTAITINAQAGETNDFFNDNTIYIYKLGNTVETFPYSYTNAGSGYTWNGTPIYWDDETNLPLNLTAVYSPTGQPTLSGRTFPWNINANQNTAATNYYDNFDLLVSALSLGTPQPADFEFNHAVSKVTVKLVAGTGFNENDLQGATIRLNGFLLNGVLDLNDGLMKNITSSQNVTPRTVKNGEEYTALVMPQLKNVADGILSVTLNGYPNPFTGKLNQALVFEAGKETVITVTLNKTAIQLSATVKDWQIGDSGSIVIE